MSKKSNTSKRYTAEFKRDAVALALSSDKTVTEVARDLGEGPAGALTTAEREELARLRRKVREQEATIEVLGKATAFFAQQKTT
ncbi:Transposase [Streptomyces sp. ADI97-07]|uniref:transposase n=1 Tax=Streptomyces sp. ADI97-07 TaxID=1522762 RepID=UPI000FA64CC0|nr:transposase [Streptomyces sp. ADI97-07]RPK76011.1 Transposase [Streptomyces sp. ADI97-07]